MKLDFYQNVEKLLLISDYPLYHSYSTILTKDLNLKVQRSMQAKDANISSKTRLQEIDMEKSYNSILLSAMSTPYSNYFTNYLKIGEELYENDKAIETETCTRMMNILKLHTVPSRKQLIQYIKDYKIHEKCDKNI